MNPVRFALVAGLAGVAFATSVRAQEPPIAPPPPGVMQPPGRPGPPKPLYQNVRIDVSITIKGDPKPITKSLSMVAADDRMSKVRAGIEIPVPSQPMVMAEGSPAPPVSTYNYRSVGVNVDAQPDILDATHVMIRLNLNFSTVYKPESGGTPRVSFGQGSHDVQGMVFESGKPLIVTQATDGETGREYSVQVTATILK